MNLGDGIPFFGSPKIERTIGNVEIMGKTSPPLILRLVDLALGRCVVRRSSPQWLKSLELYGVNDGNFVHIIARHSYFTWACLKNKATSFHPLVKHRPQWPTLTRSNAPKFDRLLIYMPVSQIPLGVR